MPSDANAFMNRDGFGSELEKHGGDILAFCVLNFERGHSVMKEIGLLAISKVHCRTFESTIVADHLCRFL